MHPYPKTIFPQKGSPIRLAMLGMIPGNGHPYSWSAIVNGYNKGELQRCPYPVIPEYMAQQSEESSGLQGAEVTHIWTDDPHDAPKVAAAARIPTILASPEDAIGQVDAVIISTDDGDNHVLRARPFIEAGLPVFVDKPLATNLNDLNWFIRKQQEGHFFMSCSGLRFSPELDWFKQQMRDAGDLRWISSAGIKRWDTYAIHALEPLHVLLGSGFSTIVAMSGKGRVMALLEHDSGVFASVPIFEDVSGLFGTLQAYGTSEILTVRLRDTYSAFKRQLEMFLASVRTQSPLIPFSDTIELMSILIAGRISISENNRRVRLDEVYAKLEPFTK